MDRTLVEVGLVARPARGSLPAQTGFAFACGRVIGWSWGDFSGAMSKLNLSLPSPAFLLTLLRLDKVRAKSKTCRARLDLVLGREKEERHGCY